MEALTDETQKHQSNSIETPEIVKILCTCKWRPSSSPHSLEHGNRLHTLLNCEYVELKPFRDNMRRLIHDEI